MKYPIIDGPFILCNPMNSGGPFYPRDKFLLDWDKDNNKIFDHNRNIKFIKSKTNHNVIQRWQNRLYRNNITKRSKLNQLISNTLRKEITREINEEILQDLINLHEKHNS